MLFSDWRKRRLVCVRACVCVGGVRGGGECVSVMLVGRRRGRGRARQSTPAAINRRRAWCVRGGVCVRVRVRACVCVCVLPNPRASRVSNRNITTFASMVISRLSLP